jgi:hypothetical protein
VSTYDLLVNLGAKAGRRLRAAPRPFVRFARRYRRQQEPEAFRREAAAIDREIAQLAAGTAPIVAGPWLSEVGYEVLYWIPFLRWFRRTYKIPRERLVVLSRGGMEPLYADIAEAYVDLFDLLTPEQLAAGNDARRAEHEQGGQKQSAAGAFDLELIAAARSRLGLAPPSMLHPSTMFRLFRQVWHGNLAFDRLWRHTRYAAMTPAFDVDLAALPREYIAAKIYTGPALSASSETQAAVRMLIAQAARQVPVVTLDTSLGVDEHRDFDLSGIPHVISARALLPPRRNLAVQAAIIARARFLVGACGGLAWGAPFLGTATIALYDNDQLLAPHLFVARQAMRSADAAPFTTVDVRALARLGIGAA